MSRPSYLAYAVRHPSVAFWSSVRRWLPAPWRRWWFRRLVMPPWVYMDQGPGVMPTPTVRPGYWRMWQFWLGPGSARMSFKLRTLWALTWQDPRLTPPKPTCLLCDRDATITGSVLARDLLHDGPKRFFCGRCASTLVSLGAFDTLTSRLA